MYFGKKSCHVLSFLGSMNGYFNIIKMLKGIFCYQSHRVESMTLLLLTISLRYFIIWWVEASMLRELDGLQVVEDEFCKQIRADKRIYTAGSEWDWNFMFPFLRALNENFASLHTWLSFVQPSVSCIDYLTECRKRFAQSLRKKASQKWNKKRSVGVFYNLDGHQ